MTPGGPRANTPPGGSGRGVGIPGGSCCMILALCVAFLFLAQLLFALGAGGVTTSPYQNILTHKQSWNPERSDGKSTLSSDISIGTILTF